jgi:hypothetical protein
MNAMRATDAAAIFAILEIVSQIAIPILSVIGLTLLTNKNKWGNVAGLASQPFWIYTTLYNELWGLFILSIIYTGIWTNGIYQWFKKEEVQPRRIQHIIT